MIEVAAIFLCPTLIIRHLCTIFKYRNIKNTPCLYVKVNKYSVDNLERKFTLFTIFSDMGNYL